MSPESKEKSKVASKSHRNNLDNLFNNKAYLKKESRSAKRSIHLVIPLDRLNDVQ